MQFTELDLAWLERIGVKHTVQVRADNVIKAVDDDPDTLYVLLSGTARVSLLYPDGRERMVSLVVSKGAFGELVMLSETTLQSSVVVIAHTNCLVGKIAYADVLAAVRRDPDLLRDIMRLTAAKSASLMREFERSTFGSGLSQIAALLFALRGEDGSVDISQDRLAGLAGKSRVTVAHHLHDLEKKGVIRLGRSKIQVLDADQLERLSNKLI